MKIRSYVPVLLVASSLALASATPVSAAVPTAHPCVEEGQCPQSGWWEPPDNTVIYNDSADGYRVDWVESYVLPPPSDQVPAWFTVIVDYYNYGNKILYFTCRGVEDPALAKEWFLRDGKEIGFVPASSTSCSEEPSLNFTLGPGQSFQVWATFHNVPWRGDRLSIEWSVVNRNGPKSAFVDPFPPRPTGWGPVEPNVDPKMFWNALTRCLVEKNLGGLKAIGPACAGIVLQGAGVVLRFFKPRQVE